jgi:hypothetical protein
LIGADHILGSHFVAKQHVQNRTHGRMKKMVLVSAATFALLLDGDAAAAQAYTSDQPEEPKPATTTAATTTAAATTAAATSEESIVPCCKRAPSEPASEPVKEAGKSRSTKENGPTATRPN